MGAAGSAAHNAQAARRAGLLSPLAPGTRQLTSACHVLSRLLLAAGAILPPPMGTRLTACSAGAFVHVPSSPQRGQRSPPHRMQNGTGNSLLMFSSYHTESRGTRRNQSPYLTKALAFFIQLRDNRGRREKCGSCRPSAQKQPGSPEQDVSSQKLCGTFAAAGQRRT